MWSRSFLDQIILLMCIRIVFSQNLFSCRLTVALTLTFSFDSHSIFSVSCILLVSALQRFAPESYQVQFFGYLMEIRSEHTNYTHNPQALPLDYHSLPRWRTNGRLSHRRSMIELTMPFSFGFKFSSILSSHIVVLTMDWILSLTTYNFWMAHGHQVRADKLYPSALVKILPLHANVVSASLDTNQVYNV